MATLASPSCDPPSAVRLLRRLRALVAVLPLLGGQALAGYTTGVGSVTFGYPSQPMLCGITVDNGPASCAIADTSWPYASLVRSAGMAYLDAQGAHLTSTAEISISNNSLSRVLMVNADFRLNDHLTFDGAYPASAVVALTVTSLGTGSATPFAGTSFEVSSGPLLGPACQYNDSGSCTSGGLFSPSTGLDLDWMLDVRSVAGVTGNPLTAIPISSGEYLSYVSALAFYDLAGNALALSFSSSSGIHYPMNASAAAVPEPAMALLMLLGLVGLSAVRRAPWTGRHARAQEGNDRPLIDPTRGSSTR